MGKWNPAQCPDCRRGRPCPLPKKCQPSRGRWNWTDQAPANDAKAIAAQPRIAIPPLTQASFRSSRSTSLLVFSARIPYEEPDGLDVTWRSATDLGRAFAPSWKILGPVLAARIESKMLNDRGLYLESAQLFDRAWETHVNEYTAEMKISYRSHRQHWDELLRRDSVTLLCYCEDLTRCHTAILSRLLVACGATIGTRSNDGKITA